MSKIDNIQELFALRCKGQGGAAHRDIIEHLERLRDLGSECDDIVEFGVRTGNSTVAFLASDAKRVYSYDIKEPHFAPTPDVKDKWAFCQADTSKLEEIPFCDLLFIDTYHTFDIVCAELRHAPRVGKYIVFHDTELFGEVGEDGRRPGINEAIDQTLPIGEWDRTEHYPNNNGLTVYTRIAPPSRNVEQYEVDE
ncbi:MAG: class I SAM-dependent methyltransferase [Planctomycetota bacterium]|nr:MAG: class I SAM-dependent methyltransferase [Planctomycetota bacterium]